MNLNFFSYLGFSLFSSSKSYFILLNYFLQIFDILLTFFLISFVSLKNRSETKIVTSCLIWIDALSNTLTNFKSEEKVFCFYISLFAYDFYVLSSYRPLSMLLLLVSERSQQSEIFTILIITISRLKWLRIWR